MLGHNFMRENLISDKIPRNNRENIKGRFNIDFPEICPFCHSDHFHIGIGYWYHLDESTRTSHSMVMANFECLECHRVFAAKPALQNDADSDAELEKNERACLLALLEKWENKDKPIFSNKDF